MSSDPETRPKFPSKEERTRCWGARDEYWSCKDTMEESQCSQLRELFEKNCSPTWVKYFDRRRQYLKFKDKMQNDGYEPIDKLRGPGKSTS